METEKKIGTDHKIDPNDFYDFGPVQPHAPEYEAIALPDHLKAALAKARNKVKEPV